MAAPSTINYNILFIKKFPHYINEEALGKHCQKYCVAGQVLKVAQKVINEKPIQQALVTFSNKDDAINASKKLYMDNEMNPDCKLQVDFF